MKRLLKTLPLAVLLLSGCYNEIENELGLLERRIETLEQSVSKMQTNVSSLQRMVEAIESHDFVKRVTTNKNPDGSTAGYTIHFTNSSPITVYNGIDAETPILGVKKAEDDLYYWTITYPSTGVTEFIENNFGVKVAATTVTPQIKIENGKWMVNYDGYAWESLGQATGADGTSFFESVSDSTDFIHFVLKDGTVLNFPTWSSYEQILRDIDAAKANMANLDTLKNILKNKVYASNIIPIVEAGDTLGYNLCFSDGRKFAFYNGVPTNRPVIAAHRDTTNEEDNSLYWCIKYAGTDDFQWLLFSGWKIKANADSTATPELGIAKDEQDNLYYWTIKYPGQQDFYFLTYNSGGVTRKVRASVITDSRVIDGVSIGEDFVTIESGGETYLIPRFNDFSVSFYPISGNTLFMPEGGNTSFTCAISPGDENYTVLPLAGDGFYAEAVTTDYNTWTVTVSAPEQFTTSSLVILISDGKGTTKSFVITINKI